MEGNAWQTSASGRLGTLKMPWANAPLITDCVCVCELVRVIQDTCKPTG